MVYKFSKIAKKDNSIATLLIVKLYKYLVVAYSNG